MEMTVSKSKDYSEDIPVFIFYLREVRYIYENTMISETKKINRQYICQGIVSNINDTKKREMKLWVQVANEQ